jgi:ABC-type branched-subunit amino acid transport system substrate-binding protein
MKTTSAITRRLVLAGSAGLLASPAIVGRAAAATRGVTDTEIVIGQMSDLSGVTAVQGVNNTNAMRLAFDEVNARGGIHGRSTHPSPHSATNRNSPSNPLLTSISVNRCISGSSRCSGMFGISS